MPGLKVQQGQIWWARLPQLSGAETSQRHPVLVVQSDAFNRSTLQTVVCIALTNNWRLAKAPGNVLLSQSDTGLPKATVANVAQIITVDKRFLIEYVSSIPSWLLESVLDGIQLLLGR